MSPRTRRCNWTLTPPAHATACGTPSGRRSAKGLRLAVPLLRGKLVIGSRPFGEAF
jgi:hypothetical protein